MRSDLVRRLAFAIPMALIVSFFPIAGGDGDPAPRIRDWALPAAAGPVQSPGEFALVGVSWPTSEPDPDGVEVRTSADGRTWTGWQELHVDDEEGPDPGVETSAVRATYPLFVDAARFVELRWTGHVPRRARIRTVDPGPDPKRPRLAAAEAMTSQPRIFNRAEWGADERIRRCCPRYASRARVAFVHHTATANDYGPGDSARIVRSIYAYHVNTNGWDDIGYNFLVDRFGQVFEGRAGGIDRAVIGAHAAGFNTGTTGVAVIGTFGSSGAPQAAINSVNSLIAWRLDVDHADPAATVRMTSGGSNKFPAGSQVDLPAISGHRDVGHTDCPGGGLYNQLPSIRSAVAATGRPKLFDPTASVPVFTPNLDGLYDSVTVSSRGSDAGDWSVLVFDPVGHHVRTFSGSGGNPSATWDGREGLDTARHGRYKLRTTLRVGAAEARPAEIEVLLANWPDGVLLQEPGSPVFRVEGGRVSGIQSGYILETHAGWHEIAAVPHGTTRTYRQGPHLPPRQGSLISYPNGPVYLVSNGQRRGFRSADDFNRLGFNWKAIRMVNPGDATMLPEGAPVEPQALRHPDGTLVQAPGTGIYWIENGLKRPVISGRIFETWFRWEETVAITSAEMALYPDGPILPFRDGSVVHTPNGVVWVISNGVRRGISSPTVFDQLGLRWSNIIFATAGEGATSREGPPL